MVGLRGRKFGAFDPETQEYRVCAQLTEDDDPAVLGIEVGTLHGGTYLRACLQGEPPGIHELIPATFQEMVTPAAVDASRPSIEFYKNPGVIDLLLPIP